MSKVYLTSDWHLFHDNIIKYCNRPFADTKEMGEAIIRNYFDVVTAKDKIFFLGDLTIKRRKDKYFEKLKTIFSLLPGEKYLVQGNHDYFSNEDYLGMGFKSVSKVIRTKEYTLIHDTNNLEMNLDLDSLIIHGHKHFLKPMNNFQNSFLNAMPCYDCGVDANGFKPVELSVIKSRLNGKNTC